MENTNFISEEEKKMATYFSEIGQSHLVSKLQDFSKEQRLAFLQQCQHLDQSCPGGLKSYTERAKKLLKDSNENVNPFEGFTPSIPLGETVSFDNLERLHHLEGLGLKELQHTCFVLVAGGLGERLGYKGIKVEIPIQLLTSQCFLHYYIDFILAFQKRCPQGTKIPLAIMTSDDTYDLTVKLIKENNYFGMEQDQLIIMKQEKVPSLINNEAHFAQDPKTLLLETKPHGHGDVHQLICQHKLHETWLGQGKKWVFFFQDTNPLVFRSLASVLGVSVEKNLEVNSITIPRKPGEAVGSICKLTHQDGRSLTLNVEYNQLDPLLKSTVGKEEVDSSGYSVFPGNINSLVFSLPEYSKVLNETKGVIAEFINPKYTDSTKTAFKSPSRLECMMQDYPKLLPNADRVGFTQIERGYSFAAVKNDILSAAAKQQSGLSPECSGSCEEAFYQLNCNLLKLCGAEFEQEKETLTFENIQYIFSPKVVLSPDFGVIVKELQNNIKNKVKISKNSSLVVTGNFEINGLDLDGHFVVDNHIKEPKVEHNKQYLNFVPIQPTETKEYLKIRGYMLNKKNENPQL